MTEEIKIIVEAIQSLGVEAKTSFIVYIVADKIFIPLAVATTVAFCVTKIAKMITHLFRVTASSYDFLRRVSHRLGFEYEYPEYETQKIMLELEKALKNQRQGE